MHSAQLAIITFSIIAVLFVGVSYWRKKSVRDTSFEQIKEEKERRLHPLSKVEIAHRQAIRRAEKEKDNE